MWNRIKSRGVLLSLGVICGTMAVLMMLAVKYGGDRFLAEIPLAGGTHRLRLLQITDGPLEYKWSPPIIHRFLPFLGPHVPPLEVQLSGLDRWTRTPGTSFLFRTVDQSGAYSTGTVGPSPEFEFIESSGYVFKDRVGMPDYPHWGTYGLTRSALPRRDKNLVILIRQSPGEPVQMVIPNPLYRDDFPVWTPEPLPAEKSIGPLTLRLTQMRSLGKQIHCTWQMNGTSEAWRNGNVQYRLEDATGNIGVELSPFEPAWKVRAWASQSQDAEFPAEVSTVLPKLPVLSVGKVSPFNREIRVSDLRCQLKCVAGRGVVVESNGILSVEDVAGLEQQPGISTSYSSTAGSTLKIAQLRPFLWIELLEPLPAHTSLVAQVTHEGKRQALDGSSMSTGDRSMLIYTLPDLGDLSEIDVTLSLSRPLECEFVVAPPEEFRQSIKPVEQPSASGHSGG